MPTDKKLSQLPAASVLTGDEVMYLTQGGVDKEVTVATLLTVAPSGSHLLLRDGVSKLLLGH